MKSSVFSKQMRRRHKAFPWLESFFIDRLKAFPCDLDTKSLQDLLTNIENEIKASIIRPNEKRNILLFEVLKDLLLHFWWRLNLKSKKDWKKYGKKVKFNACSSDVNSKGFSQLLHKQIYLGIILSDGSTSSPWLSQILLIISILPSFHELLYNSLLLIKDLDMKYHPAYVAILKHVLCTEVAEQITEPPVYLKVIVLFRKLKKFTSEKATKCDIASIASRIKPPPNTIAWLSLFETDIAVKNESDIASALLKQKYSSEVFQKICLLVTQNQPTANKEVTHPNKDVPEAPKTEMESQPDTENRLQLTADSGACETDLSKPFDPKCRSSKKKGRKKKKSKNKIKNDAVKKKKTHSSCEEKTMARNTICDSKDDVIASSLLLNKTGNRVETRKDLKSPNEIDVVHRKENKIKKSKNKIKKDAVKKKKTHSSSEEKTKAKNKICDSKGDVKASFLSLNKTGNRVETSEDLKSSNEIDRVHPEENKIKKSKKEMKNKIKKDAVKKKKTHSSSEEKTKAETKIYDSKDDVKASFLSLNKTENRVETSKDLKSSNEIEGVHPETLKVKNEKQPKKHKQKSKDVNKSEKKSAKGKTPSKSKKKKTKSQKSPVFYKSNLNHLLNSAFAKIITSPKEDECHLPVKRRRCSCSDSSAFATPKRPCSENSIGTPQNISKRLKLTPDIKFTDLKLPTEELSIQHNKESVGFTHTRDIDLISDGMNVKNNSATSLNNSVIPETRQVNMDIEPDPLLSVPFTDNELSPCIIQNDTASYWTKDNGFNESLSLLSYDEGELCHLEAPALGGSLSLQPNSESESCHLKASSIGESLSLQSYGGENESCLETPSISESFSLRSNGVAESCPLETPSIGDLQQNSLNPPVENAADCVLDIKSPAAKIRRKTSVSKSPTGSKNVHWTTLLKPTGLSDLSKHQVRTPISNSSSSDNFVKNLTQSEFYDQPTQIECLVPFKKINNGLLPCRQTCTEEEIHQTMQTQRPRSKSFSDDISGKVQKLFKTMDGIESKPSNFKENEATNKSLNETCVHSQSTQTLNDDLFKEYANGPSIYGQTSKHGDRSNNVSIQSENSETNWENLTSTAMGINSSQGDKSNNISIPIENGIGETNKGKFTPTLMGVNSSLPPFLQGIRDNFFFPEMPSFIPNINVINSINTNSKGCETECTENKVSKHVKCPNEKPVSCVINYEIIDNSESNSSVENNAESTSQIKIVLNISKKKSRKDLNKKQTNYSVNRESTVNTNGLGNLSQTIHPYVNPTSDEHISVKEHIFGNFGRNSNVITSNSSSNLFLNDPDESENGMPFLVPYFNEFTVSNETRYVIETPPSSHVMSNSSPLQVSLHKNPSFPITSASNNMDTVKSASSTSKANPLTSTPRTVRKDNADFLTPNTSDCEDLSDWAAENINLNDSLSIQVENILERLSSPKENSTNTKEDNLSDNLPLFKPSSLFSSVSNTRRDSYRGNAGIYSDLTNDEMSDSSISHDGDDDQQAILFSALDSDSEFHPSQINSEHCDLKSVSRNRHRKSGKFNCSALNLPCLIRKQAVWKICRDANEAKPTAHTSERSKSKVTNTSLHSKSKTKENEGCMTGKSIPSPVKSNHRYNLRTRKQISPPTKMNDFCK